MKWIEVSIKTESRAVEAVSEVLQRYGANGVAIDDPSDLTLKDNQSISWDYIDENLLKAGKSVYVKAYYPDDNQIQNKINQIKESLKNVEIYLETGKISLETKVVDDMDWANEWKKHYKPLKVGKRILIKPTWEEAVGNDDDILIQLDPGMAFGTGTHESTKMCIEFLEKYVKERRSLLDVGCGSGILSIVGAKLGCSEVLAIDIDPVAVRTAEDNINANGVKEKVHAETAVIEDINGQIFDIIVANIVADVIINITSTVRKSLEEGGIYIVSGIIKDRKQDVEDKLVSEGFKVLEQSDMGEWVAMAAECRNFL